MKFIHTTNLSTATLFSGLNLPVSRTLTLHYPVPSIDTKKAPTTGSWAAMVAANASAASAIPVATATAGKSTLSASLSSLSFCLFLN
jgi:hypothetical protein